MASFNKITIVGYLGRDPEIRYLPDGTAVCNFSIATTERRKDKAGEWQDITTWFKVTLWRQQAERANQYLSKGKQVFVEGRLTTQDWTDRDGNRRTSLEVTATDIHFLTPRGEEGGASNFPSSSSSASSSKPTSMPPSGGDDDGDIPF
ncbi:MAG TPA: single-stranded DNA-binding protein [Blastocatellia bacterium]|nr:single-stranded DNA-binding protein [Blastocatellia bacterium]HMX25889.1 single-stranded DNA-binding protein [Blastocatellia bacterium]HMZ19003.1 single-stranded DNA-binding protein [Blastocatellia bacterium]HNG28309.1 single-stranded DNA-binding protein [Blastocatellia bacterium]